LMDHYSALLGKSYKELSIRKTSSKRWSCTHDQKVCLNLSLVHLPTKYIIYVIIHEVCHLKVKIIQRNFGSK
jgi:predicted metal-dependent hydrolase